MQDDANQRGDRWQTIQSVEEMLDYAMIGGAELQLPMFVLLLRMARLELERTVCRPEGHETAAETPVIPANTGLEIETGSRADTLV